MLQLINKLKIFVALLTTSNQQWNAYILLVKKKKKTECETKRKERKVVFNVIKCHLFVVDT